MIKTTIIGRAVHDFQLRKDNEDRSWGTFTIASNRKYTKRGEEKPRADYISVYVSGDFAEQCALNIKKGTQVAATGDLEINTETGKDGKAYTNVELRNCEIQWFAK